MSRDKVDDLFDDFDESQDARSGESPLPRRELGRNQPALSPEFPAATDWGDMESSFPAEGSVSGPEGPAEEELVEAPMEPSEEDEEQARPKKPGIFARLAQTSPYVVMLFLSLLALIVGTLMLGVELWRYQFEIKPPT